MDVYEGEFFVRRRVKYRKVYIDNDSLALTVAYDVEAEVIAESGKILKTDSKAFTAPINIDVDQQSDCDAYARRLIQNVKILPESSLPCVVALVHDLKTRLSHLNTLTILSSGLKRDDPKFLENDQTVKQGVAAAKSNREASTQIKPTLIADIERHLESLYESDHDAQEKSIASILAFANDELNLQSLMSNEVVLGVITRTLRDNYKCSKLLSARVLELLVRLSTYSQYHDLLRIYRVGKTTMEVVRWELEELKSVKSRTVAEHSVDVLIKLIFTLSFKILLNLSETLNVEKKMVDHGLLNDIEDVWTDEQIKAEDFQIVILRFFKKLAVVRENVETFHKRGFEDKLLRIVTDPKISPLPRRLAIASLLNLSFHPEVRFYLVSKRIIPNMLSLFIDVNFQSLSLKILYNLSLEPSCTDQFAEGKHLRTLLKTLFASKDFDVRQTLGKVLVNLSASDRICMTLCQRMNFKMLLECSLKERSASLMTVIRNLSAWTLELQINLSCSKSNFASQPVEIGKQSGLYKHALYTQGETWREYVPALAALVTEGFPSTCALLATDILSNLTPADFPVGSRLQEVVRKLVSSVKKIVEGESETLLLRIIAMIGQICIDVSAAEIVLQSKLLIVVFDRIHQVADQAEIFLQSLFCCFRILLHRNLDASDLLHFLFSNVLPKLCNHESKSVLVMADKLLYLAVLREQENKLVEAETGTKNPHIQKQSLSASTDFYRLRFEQYNHDWLISIQNFDNGKQNGMSRIYLSSQ